MVNLQSVAYDINAYMVERIMVGMIRNGTMSNRIRDNNHAVGLISIIMNWVLGKFSE